MTTNPLRYNMTLAGNQEEYRFGVSPSGGTRDYEQLINRPSIEEVELIGDKTFEELGLIPLTNIELEELLK